MKKYLSEEESLRRRISQKKNLSEEESLRRRIILDRE